MADDFVGGRGQPAFRSLRDGIVFSETRYALRGYTHPPQACTSRRAEHLAHESNSESDPKKGESLFKVQSCITCHTTADGQTPKGPHLVDIGKRDEIEARVQQKQSAMPEGLVANLTPDQLADLLAYLQSLK